MTMPEWFDVVDAHDRPQRRATRADVHAQCLRHRAIHVWIQNRAGDWLLQLRSMRKDMHPGTWDSACSGHVDAGEGYDEAARRELKEELGVRPAQTLPRLYYQEACAETGWEFVWLYLWQHEGPFQPCPHEIDAVRWFSTEELSAVMQAEPRAFARPFRFFWERREEILATKPGR